MRLVGSPSGRHGGLENRSRPILGLGVGRSQSVIPVIGGPVELIVTVFVIDRILGLMPGCVDECERLAHE